MFEQEFAQWSASHTASQVKSKSVSPVEVTRAAIDRIEQINSRLNAVVFSDFEQALEQARSLEKKIMAGNEPGPLAGVPTLIKDLFSFKPGWPATLGGIRALRDYAPDFYSTFPERVEKSGSIVLGKTNSAAMGFCGVTDNKMFGPTRNPFDLRYNSGGSSGGAAAAVASGLVPVAEASDGGGSIRIPAAWCGLIGFQPSFGTIPAIMRPNAFGATAPFLYDGPLARTVEDIALTLSVLSGHDPRDPFSAAKAPDFKSALTRPIKGMRIGVTRDFGIFPVDTRIADRVQATARILEDAGAIVEPLDIHIPHTQKALSDLWCRMIASVSHGAILDLAKQVIDLWDQRQDELPAALKQWVNVASGMSLEDIQADQAMRTDVFDAFTRAFEKHDLILSPVTSCMPCRNGETGDTVGSKEIGGIPVDPRIGWAMTYLTNFTGHPAASVPAGVIEGLPVGVQIIGKRHGDLSVLSACAALEKINPWAETYERVLMR